MNAIDDKNKPTDNNPSNVNHERSSVVKRPQLTVDVKEIQLTPPDIAMMRTMAKYMAGSVVVFPIGTYISNRYFKRQNMFASSGWKRLLASGGVGGFCSWVLLILGNRSMDRSIDSLDTPMARQMKQQRAQLLEDLHYEERIDRDRKAELESQRKSAAKSDKKDN